MAEPIEMPFGLWARMGPRSRVLDGVQIAHEKEHFWEKASPIVKYRDFLPWAVQKRPNRSICRLSCGLVDSGGPKDAQVQSYSPGGVNVPSHMWAY